MKNLNENKSILPKYLEELVNPTFGAFSKLTLVWDALSVETQILIIDYYVVNCPTHLVNGLCNLAINSQNEYIQYCGVKHGYLLNDNIRSFAASSKNPLLFCFSNNLFNRCFIPQIFFGLEQQQRLNLINYHPETKLVSLVEILKYYYQHHETKKIVSKTELIDIVNEFKNNKNILLESQTFGFGDYIFGILDIVDEEIGLILVDLVSYEWNFGNEIIFQNIPEKIVSKLFNRSDIFATDVRRQVVFNNKYDIETRCSAASHHFSIQFPSSEFSGILNLPHNEKADLIFILSFANDCDLITLCAARDLVYVFGNQSGEGIRRLNAKDRIKRIIESNLIKMEFLDKVKNLNLIRCYLIGKSKIPWNQNGPLEFKCGESELLSKIFRSAIGKQYVDTYHLMFDLFRDIRFNFDDLFTIELEKFMPTEFDFLVSNDVRHFISSRLEKVVHENGTYIENKILLLDDKIDANMSINSKCNSVINENRDKFELYNSQTANIQNSIDEIKIKLNSLNKLVLLFLIILAAAFMFQKIK